MKTVGDTIRDIRKAKKIKQKELALMCNLSTNSIVNIEHGYHEPTTDTLKIICHALDVSEAVFVLNRITEEDFKEGQKILFKAMLIPLMVNMNC